MTSTPAGSSTSGAVPAQQATTGHFMLTLCQLAGPVSIRPPQSPHLKAYTFFTSSARGLDGSERLYLHMGYFATLDDAERWARIAREHYPEAFATLAPAGASERPESLSDTQVLKILERRGVPDAEDGPGERSSDQIALLRPEDTSTRQALKEAVAQGAPVSFAVQLEWSPKPLDLARVPALAAFRGHTLYESETCRDGRSRYFLRLGFFADPVSAKQVAAQVRANFASAAVVPVAEQEVARAREAAVGSSIPSLAQARVAGSADSTTAAASSTETKRSGEEARRRISRGRETLEQTLRRLAARERWTDPDSLSESGVRHLRIEVQKHRSGRSSTK
jgi:hypothetical protein